MLLIEMKCHSYGIKSILIFCVSLAQIHSLQYTVVQSPVFI